MISALLMLLKFASISSELVWISTAFFLINRMSIVLFDLGGSPRYLFNFLMNRGIFFPSVLAAKTKTPSKTVK